jgi:hypothetical protein
MLGGKCNSVRSIVHYYVKVSEIWNKIPRLYVYYYNYSQYVHNIEFVLPVPCVYCDICNSVLFLL